ncbi:MAG: hypothetical protein RR510_01550 [Morganella sp. (in: enterobacteria)]
MSKLTRLVLVAGIALSFVAHSETQGHQGGTISFQGALVESPCSYKISDDNINTECHRSGQANPYNGQMQAGNNFKGTLLPDHIGETQVMPLPSDPDKYIVTLSYR